MSRYPNYLVCSCTWVWRIYLDFVWMGLRRAVEEMESNVEDDDDWKVLRGICK
ncbi:hypothetical protein V6Z11_A06G134000 [Gossypium hirsutum]